MGNGENYKVGVILDVQGGSRAESELRKFDSGLNRAGSSASSFFSSFAGNVASNVFSKVTSAAVDGGRAMLDYSSKMEQTQIGFETLMGGAQAATKHLEDLKKFAVDTPFEFETLTKMSQRLQGVGVEGKRVIPIMKDIGNVVAATGEISAERIEGVTVAVGQMISKTKVSAEEMEQLSERGVSGWKILAEFLGKSQAEVRKMSEEGKISAETMVAALHKASETQFGDAMAKQSKTFAGSWSTITDIASQSGQDLFKPVYDEISKFSGKFAESLQSQEANAKGVGSKWGFAVGESIGDAIGRGVKKSGWMDFLLSGPAGLASFGVDLYAGYSKGFESANKTSQSLADLRRMDDKILGTKINSIADLRRVDDTIRQIAADVKAVNPIDEELKAEKAAKDAKTLSAALDDITSRVAFFGQETEVAAAKQDLINQGITNFNSGTAKSILNFAGIFDKLKSAQKEQEAYNSKLKTASEYMSDMRENADFQTRFPNATPLQQFDQWARKNAENFKELKFEMESTRRALEHQAWMSAWKDFKDGATMAFAGLDQEFLRVKARTSDIATPLVDFALKMKIIGANERDTIEQSAENFSLIVESLLNNVDKAKQIQEELKQAVPNIDRQSVEWKGTEVAISSAEKALESYLNTVQSKLADGTTAPIFKDVKPGHPESVAEFIKKLRQLREAANDQKLQQGFKNLDEVLSDLNLTIGGFGKKSELEKFNEWLSDPVVTKAIEQRADAIGLSADAYKKLLQQQKEAQLAQLTRPRIVGKQNKDDNPFADGMFGEMGVSKIQSEAEMVANIYTQLGQTAGAALNSLAGAMGSLVENWVLYGNTSGMSARKAIAAALGMAAAQSTVSAIMETAYGIAALTPWGAAIYGPAPFHFKSAALFGMIAAGTALGGRAVAGNSFNSPGASSGSTSQPDYYTSNPTESPGVRQFNGNVQTSNQSTTLGDKLARIAEAVEKFENKISSMKEGELFVRGANANKGIFAERATREVKTNSSVKRELQTALSLG
jgi:tape measure domain-containing protein